MTNTTPLRTLLIAAIAAIALLVGLLAATALGGSRAQAAPLNSPAGDPVATQGVTVVGTASATGTPDTLRLDLGVMVTKDSVADALASANSTMAAVQAALRKAGVDAKDMATNGLSIQPQYDYQDKGVPIARGYQVVQTLKVTIRDLDKAGAVIGAATAAGGNATTVNSLGLDLDDPEGVLASARAAAVANAKAKAEAYAAAAGRSLGVVTTITEQSYGTPGPVWAGREMAMAGGAASSPVPISPGTQDYTVTVTVTYALA